MLAEIDGTVLNNDLTYEERLELVTKLRDRVKEYIRSLLEPFKYSSLEDPQAVLGNE